LPRAALIYIARPQTLLSDKRSDTGQNKRVQVSKNPVMGKAITGKFLGLLGTRRRDVAEYTLRTSPSARLIGLTKVENVPEKTKHFRPKVFYFFFDKTDTTY
jgi:hypothetical protein